MCLLFLLLIAAAIFFVKRNGGPGRPPWMSAPDAPEDEAKRVLSERFAKGDISTDEFLERASVLNWTPGSEPPSAGGRKRR